MINHNEFIGYIGYIEFVGYNMYCIGVDNDTSQDIGDKLIYCLPNILYTYINVLYVRTYIICTVVCIFSMFPA